MQVRAAAVQCTQGVSGQEPKRCRLCTNITEQTDQSASARSRTLAAEGFSNTRAVTARHFVAVVARSTTGTRDKVAHLRRRTFVVWRINPQMICPSSPDRSHPPFPISPLRLAADRSVEWKISMHRLLLPRCAILRQPAVALLLRSGTAAPNPRRRRLSCLPPLPPCTKRRLSSSSATATGRT
jgi:hypothetical protein